MPQPASGDLNPEKHGPWTIVRRNEVYRDAWLSVQMDNVLRPDGLPGTYSTVRIKPGVCVIPVAEDGTCYMTKEFHYAVGRDTIEGISGGIEDGETPELAASRELQEEVGIVAGKLVDLGVVDPLTAALRSPTKMFLATDLRFTQSTPESTECIERVEIPFSKVLRMVIENEITHAPSCVAILKANLILNTVRQA
jgi:8-oxo-dGTP pyrophosphatase MutT (NUDIX family)